MDALRRDIRHALRSWRRTPGPIAASIAALALGIGANSAIFSVVAGVLLKPLPYQNPDRLVMLWQDLRARGGPERDLLSPGLFVEWRQRASAFDAVAAVRGWSPNLTGAGEPERLRGAAVSADYFRALGIAPAAGRMLGEADDRPDADRVVVISEGLWTRLFNRDPAMVGRAIVLDGQPYTVAGIMPAAFDPPIVNAEIWSPLGIDPVRAPRGIVVLRVLARLKPGVTLPQAQADLAGVAAQLESEDPEWARARAAVVPLADEIVGGVRQMLIVLTLAVAVVLCIACANVMSLLLARASDRGREMAIRTAMGAARSDLVRALLVESMLIAALGGVAGLGLAWWGLRGLIAAAPASAPRLHEVSIDSGVVVFTILVTLATAVISGMAPAAATLRARLNRVLREGGRESTSSGRARAAIVTAEIALALMLVVGAALLVRTLVALQRVDMGFEPSHLLTAAVTPPRTQYRDPAAARQLFHRLLERASAVPGVRDAALTNMLPLSGGDFNLSFQIEGRPPAATPGAEPAAGARIVSPSYLRTMGMRLRAGRDLSPLDGESSPGAVLVNETMARRYWAGASPLGAKIFVGDLEATVVGVVDDVRHRGPGAAPGAEMYIPLDQFNARQAIVVLRTTGDPARAAAGLRAAMRDVDPALPLANVATMEALLARSVAPARFVAALLTGFAFLAAVLAVVGIYGLLSFSVSRRVRELGVRMALGADRRRVLRLVLRQSALMAAAGIGAGVVLSAAASRALRTLLFGVEPNDPTTTIAAAAAIAAAALAASLPPALRAARIDPVVALRDE